MPPVRQINVMSALPASSPAAVARMPVANHVEVLSRLALQFIEVMMRGESVPYSGSWPHLGGKSCISSRRGRQTCPMPHLLLRTNLVPFCRLALFDPSAPLLLPLSVPGRARGRRRLPAGRSGRARRHQQRPRHRRRHREPAAALPHIRGHGAPSCFCCACARAANCENAPPPCRLSSTGSPVACMATAAKSRDAPPGTGRFPSLTLALRARLYHIVS